MLVRSLVLLVFSLVLVGIAGAAPALAQKPACTLIDTLPYTIKEPGHYCLPGGVMPVTLSSGSAIEIAADGVDLDLNDTLVDNSTAGQNIAYGIRSLVDVTNVSVHGGTLRGFFTGLSFQTGRVRNGLVENLHVDYAAHYGIGVDGWEIVVRNNSITNTGSHDSVQAVGILASGTGLRILGNDISETYPGAQSAAYGIIVSAKTLAPSTAVIEGNRVSNSALVPATYGTIVTSTAAALVVGNRYMSLATGLSVSNTATGKYRDNLALGCTIPYAGITNAGNNN